MQTIEQATRERPDPTPTAVSHVPRSTEPQSYGTQAKARFSLRTYSDTRFPERRRIRLSVGQLALYDSEASSASNTELANLIATLELDEASHSYLLCGLAEMALIAESERSLR